MLGGARARSSTPIDHAPFAARAGVDWPSKSGFGGRLLIALARRFRGIAANPGVPRFSSALASAVQAVAVRSSERALIRPRH